MNSVLDNSQIIFDSQAKTKDDALNEIAKIGSKLFKEVDEKSIFKALKERENVSSTGFEDGFAIPHARLSGISEPKIIFVRYKDEVEWKSIDKKGTKIAIAILVPFEENNLHLQILSKIAVSLNNKDFRDKLKSINDKKEVVDFLMSISNNEQKVENVKKEGKKLILGMTACPTGVAHTFLAADKLTQTAKELDYNVKVETHGQEGVRNTFTDEELEQAEVVIVASDIGLDLSKLNGKKVYQTRVATAIKEPKELIARAIKDGKILNMKSEKGEFATKTDKNSGQKTGIMKHLMSGVSYMVPLVIFGGIFIALSLGLSKAVYGYDYNPGDHPENFFYYLLKLGEAAFTLMIPILGAFIAHSIAGRAALAPAIIVSLIGNTPAMFYPLPGIEAVNTPTGFIGAILVGVAVGFTVKWINTWNVPKNLRPIMPIFVIPLLVGFVYGMIMMFVIGSVVGFVMEKFGGWIQSTWGASNSLTNVGIGLGFGLLIGAMAGFDMGGPINKIAFLASTGLIASEIYTPMGAMAVAIPVAPLGMGIATMLFRPLFDKDDRTLGITALLMGVIGISEGAIPFAVKDPKRVIPANLIGSTIAGGLAGAVGIANLAGHGGPIVGLLSALGRGNGATGSYGWGQAAGWTMLAFAFMLIGAIITALIYGTLKIIEKRKTNKDVSFKNIVFAKKEAKATKKAK